MDSVGPNRLAEWLYFELSDSVQFAGLCIFIFVRVVNAATFYFFFKYILLSAFSLPTLKISQTVFTE